MFRMKDQSLLTQLANSFNRVHQLTRDVLDPAHNQYGLDLSNPEVQAANRHLITALEHIQVANVKLAALEDGISNHAKSALKNRRSKVLTMVAVTGAEGGTPVLDSGDPIPEPVAEDGDDASEKKTPAKAAKKKASAKKPASKAAKAKGGKKKPST